MSAPSPFDNLTGMSFGNYHCEELIERSDLGPVYLARGRGSDALYRLRVLPVRTDLPPQSQAAYLDRFIRQANHLSTLQHPHILPLVDFGHENGLPYLVYPAVPLRSLSSALAENSPLDPILAGRYLDQIASALAYAHDRSTLHRHLTTDNIYLQQDGQIAIADFGVRRIIELSEPEDESNPLRFSIETAAPEQLTGRPVERPADIYALGAVLYRLLTGAPVFTGRTREEIARQQVYSPVPSLSQWRSGLPPVLDDIIATAMAKLPEQRFPRPEALLSAYLQAITPGRPSRVFPPGAGLVQPPTAAQRVAGVSAAASRASVSPPYGPSSEISGPHFPQLATDDSLGDPPRTWERPFESPSRSRRRHGWLLIVTAVTLVVAVLGTVFVLRGGTPASGPASARVLFSDSSAANPGNSDEIQITAANLPAPPSGSNYDAWLINSQTEQVVPLGTLTPQHSGYTLTYFGKVGTTLSDANLLSVGDTIEVTLEHGSAAVPVGSVVLRVRFPSISFVHIQHILVSFPSTPGKIGLLVGALSQTHLLVSHAQALETASKAHNYAQVQCEAQSLINILEGAQGSRYQPLSAACSASDSNTQGDGYGLLGLAASGSYGGTGYYAEATEHASLAANQSDSTPDMHTHLALLLAGINDARTWATQLDAAAASLLTNPSDTSKTQTILNFAQRAYSGYDANHDGKIAPVAGEAGILTAYQQGQLMATLTLTPTS